MTPLRISLISEHASPLAAAGGADAGGQNVYVDEVARHLAEAGHRVEVLTRRDDAALPPVVALPSGARIVHVDAGPPRFVPKEELLPFMPAFAAATRRHWTRTGMPDVMHANFFMSGWVGLALKQRFGLPLVITFHALGLVRRQHQGKADRFPEARLAIERELVRRSDRVIASCPQDEDDLMHLYAALPERLARVPCGVDTLAFRPGDRAAARTRLGLPADEFIVLQLGRLVPCKGVDNVIRAMARVPGQLYVVGGESDTPDETLTPEIARLKRVALANGLPERVHFTGRRPRDALRDWYLAADVFVTTPWYEPFGITPLEAMACATPVIGSAVGGVAHTVRHGVTGFLVPPHDPPALAQRLDELRTRPDLARAFGEAGVERVRSLFTWDQVADRLQRVYDAVRKRSSLPARAMLSTVAP